jgi:hypothetical protein
LMAEWCARCGVAVWAYGLMPNHVHLSVVPRSVPSPLAGRKGGEGRRYPRVSLRPAIAKLRYTRGYSPAPRWGEDAKRAGEPVAGAGCVVRTTSPRNLAVARRSFVCYVGHGGLTLLFLRAVIAVQKESAHPSQPLAAPGRPCYSASGTKSGARRSVCDLARGIWADGRTSTESR